MKNENERIIQERIQAKQALENPKEIFREEPVQRRESNVRIPREESPPLPTQRSNMNNIARPLSNHSETEFETSPQKQRSMQKSDAQKRSTANIFDQLLRIQADLKNEQTKIEYELDSPPDVIVTPLPPPPAPMRERTPVAPYIKREPPIFKPRKEYKHETVDVLKQQEKDLVLLRARGRMPVISDSDRTSLIDLTSAPQISNDWYVCMIIF